MAARLGTLLRGRRLRQNTTKPAGLPAGDFAPGQLANRRYPRPIFIRFLPHPTAGRVVKKSRAARAEYVNP